MFIYIFNKIERITFATDSAPANTANDAVERQQFGMPKGASSFESRQSAGKS